ncbi:uncharacterized protein LOC128862731 isoform X2 [Anastrepha ludens]|uniref:uncharacterized protein LOC128862731 isoform X2 n=1 Tax=Anastrepha ludens TaxID=28586 RepID=UPI0023B02777|nr:uncharacterized protein LOC128862731 isoform X2 [Anastrepha ludens]
MSIVNIIKKASTLILGEDKISENIDAYEDNEVLFCKNNVCIHPPVAVRRESELIHYPGYLTVTTKTFVDQFNEARRSTLLLTWIPNSSLCKSKSNENEMYKKSKKFEVGGPLSELSLSNSNELSESKEEKITYSDQKVEIDGPNVDIQELKNELQPLLGDHVNSMRDINALLNRSHITSVNITISNPHIENTNVKHSINSVVTDINKVYFQRGYYLCDDANLCCATSELFSLQNNVDVGDKSSTPFPRNNSICRRFSVDLSQMRSLRLFFSDDNCTSGQLVIASRESQYKILHFHYGGLDHLAQVHAFRYYKQSLHGHNGKPTQKIRQRIKKGSSPVALFST